MRIGSILTLPSLSYLVDMEEMGWEIDLISYSILSFLCQLDMIGKRVSRLRLDSNCHLDISEEELDLTS